MPITQVGTIQALGSKNGVSTTLTFDVALQEGDVVYLIGGNNLSRTPNQGPSTGGYTQLFLNTTGSAFGVWRKRMGASPDASVVTIASGNAADTTCYASIALRGVDPSTQEDVALTSATGSSTNPNPPSIDPVTDDCAIIIAAGSAVADTAPGTVTNYTTQGIASGADTNPFTATLAFRILTGHAPEDPGAWPAWLTGAWKAVTIAVRPAPPPVEISPAEASLSLVEFAPNVSRTLFVILQPPTDDLIITGLAPTPYQYRPLNTPATNSFTLAGQTPTRTHTLNHFRTPILRTAALTGYAPIPTIGGSVIKIWFPYNEAKKYLASADIDLDSHTFRIALFTAASNCTNATLSTKGSVTGEISATSQIAAVAWEVGASAKQYKLSCAELVWNGAVNGVKFAVLWDETTSKLLSRSELFGGSQNIPPTGILRLRNPQGVFNLV